MTFYFASKYSNLDALNEIKEKLEATPHNHVNSRWLHGGHTGGTTGDKRRYAEDDMLDIERATTTVVFELPIGKAEPSTGRAFELGYAVALGKRVVLVGEKRSVFHYLSGIEHYATVEEFLEMYA